MLTFCPLSCFDSPNQHVYNRMLSILKHQMISKGHVIINLKGVVFKCSHPLTRCAWSYGSIFSAEGRLEHCWRRISIHLRWIADECCSIIAVVSPECQIRELCRMQHNYNMASMYQLYNMQLRHTMLSNSSEYHLNLRTSEMSSSPSVLPTVSSGKFRKVIKQSHLLNKICELL